MCSKLLFKCLGGMKNNIVSTFLLLFYFFSVHFINFAYNTRTQKLFARQGTIAVDSELSNAKYGTRRKSSESKLLRQAKNSRLTVNCFSNFGFDKKKSHSRDKWIFKSIWRGWEISFGPFHNFQVICFLFFFVLLLPFASPLGDGKTPSVTENNKSKQKAETVLLT